MNHLYMDMPGLANQQEPTYNSFVLTQDVVWKTSLEWWLIGMNGERESGKSVLVVRLDDEILTIVALSFSLVLLKYFFTYPVEPQLQWFLTQKDWVKIYCSGLPHHEALSKIAKALFTLYSTCGSPQIPNKKPSLLPSNYF